MTSCTTKSNHFSHNDTIIHLTFNHGPKLPANEWHVYNVDNQEKICIPSKWPLLNQNKYLFVANLNNPDSNAYFIVLKYDKKATGMTEVKYLKDTYSQIKNDTIQHFIGYKVNKMAYSDKVVFSSEYYTSINNIRYVTYSTVFEEGDYLFDIALKTEQEWKSYQETYTNILYNFYYNNNLAFSDKDQLKGFENIDLNNL